MSPPGKVYHECKSAKFVNIAPLKNIYTRCDKRITLMEQDLDIHTYWR
jgi:hypothetical protein